MTESHAVEARTTNGQKAGNGELIVSSFEPQQVIQSNHATIPMMNGIGSFTTSLPPADGDADLRTQVGV